MMETGPAIFKRFFLPVPLYERFADFVQSTYGVKPFSRDHFDLMSNTLERFESVRIHLSSNIGKFKSFLNTAFSTHTLAYPFCLRKNDLMKINSLRYRFNVGPANSLKLIMCYYLFQSDDCAFDISPADLVSSFMPGHEYKYPILLSKEINDLYESTMSRENTLNKTMYMRAAHFYYTYLSPEIPEFSEGPVFHVDNQCTGWKKFTIQGGPRLRDYVSRMKKETGKPIDTIISNVLYSFLSEYNGNGTAHESA
jgi:hypothetical protein